MVGLLGWSNYNKLVTTDEVVSTNWAQVETQLQRRFDLIPNLVEATKGMMTQEQEVFGRIAEARENLAGAGTVNQRVEASGQLESALSRLLVVMENYPNLRSSEAVQNLMTQLEGTENRVSVARQRFNEAVQEFNLKVRRVPSNIFAKIFGFDEKEKFESVEGASEAPVVDLNVSE